MNLQLQLNEREWQIVLELLESEHRELPPEIHHTDTPRVQEELEERKRIVDNLIGRLRQQQAS